MSCPYEEFRSCFRAMLDLLCEVARRVIVAPPVLRGEDLESHTKRRLGELAGLIEAIAAECDRAEFLDLQAAFARELAARPGTAGLTRNPFRAPVDALALRTDGRVDSKAAQRGLQLTLDGVHLNSAAAKLVARELKATIENRATPVHQGR